MSDGEVLYPQFGDRPIVIEPDDYSKPLCFHEFVFIQRNTRRVACRVCKKEVDPFDIVLKWAREWSTATWLDGELKKREAQVEALKQEEQRIKGRLRNGKRSVRSELIDAHFDELLARMSKVHTHNDLWSLEEWRRQFNWFTPEQTAALREAYIAANRRVEDSQRTTKRRRVRVVAGGKTAGES